MSLFLFIEQVAFDFGFDAPLPLRAACSMEGEYKLVCLLACMMAEPFPACLRYDILLRPWFAPLDLSFHRRTRQILN